VNARLFSDPDHAAAADAIEDGLDDAAVVTASGRCTVDYDGRASSHLGPGDRLVVLKPDGTLLVHQSEQRTPVNWQPPGCDHAATVTERRLVVLSTRESPNERVEVRFESVSAVAVYPMEDTEELELRGTEEDLRDRILGDPSLVEAGLHDLEAEYDTPVGAADLVGRDAEGHLTVLELKRRRVGPTAVSQLERYVAALGSHDPVRGVLVAPSVTDGAHHLLDAEDLEFVSLEP
jgi:RecB family endonuclease NucS